jgi:hypothetical protein
MIHTCCLDLCKVLEIPSCPISWNLLLSSVASGRLWSRKILGSDSGLLI